MVKCMWVVIVCRSWSFKLLSTTSTRLTDHYLSTSQMELAAVRGTLNEVCFSC